MVDKFKEELQEAFAKRQNRNQNLAQNTPNDQVVNTKESVEESFENGPDKKYEYDPEFDDPNYIPNRNLDTKLNPAVDWYDEDEWGPEDLKEKSVEEFKDLNLKVKELTVDEMNADFFNRAKLQDIKKDFQPEEVSSPGRDSGFFAGFKNLIANNFKKLTNVFKDKKSDLIVAYNVNNESIDLGIRSVNELPQIKEKKVTTDLTDIKENKKVGGMQKSFVKKIEEEREKDPDVKITRL